MERIAGRATTARRRPNRLMIDVVITLGVVLVVGAPAIFTKNGFEYDFTNHLWLVSVQEYSIYHNHVPTYFTNTATDGVFYPFFVFYGGTLYALTGAIAAILAPHIVWAYVGVILLGIGASYGGLLWLGRQIGLRSWLAHAPAFTYVASAYFTSNLYGRGAWPEFMATSAIPLVAASAWSLAFGKRARLLPGALFVISGVIFTGSHNITLLLGAIAGVMVILILAVAGGRQTIPSLGRSAIIVGLSICALLVNAWFLLPDVLFESRTAIAAGAASIPWSATAEFNSFWVLFDPFRHVPKHQGTPALYLQLPWLVMVWALVAATVRRRHISKRMWKLGFGLLALWVITVLPILVQGLWNALPTTLQEVQFPYRFETYSVLAMSGIVMAGALQCVRLVARGWRLGLNVGLGIVLAFGSAACVWQLWVPNTHDVLSYDNRDQALVSPFAVPQTWYDGGDYHDDSQKLISSATTLEPIEPPTLVTSDTDTYPLKPPSGLAPFATNISAGSYLVKVTGGAKFVGRTPTNYQALERTKPGTGPIHITIQPAGGTLTTGRVMSYVGIIALALWFLAAAVLKLQRRVRRRSAGDRPVEAIISQPSP